MKCFPLYAIAKRLPRHIIDWIYKCVSGHISTIATLATADIWRLETPRDWRLWKQSRETDDWGAVQDSIKQYASRTGIEKLTTRRLIHKVILYHKLPLPEHIYIHLLLHHDYHATYMRIQHKQDSQERKPPRASTNLKHHISPLFSSQQISETNYQKQ